MSAYCTDCKELVDNTDLENPNEPGAMCLECFLKSLSKEKRRQYDTRTGT